VLDRIEQVAGSVKGSVTVVQNAGEWLVDGNPKQSPVLKRFVSLRQERVHILIQTTASVLYSVLLAAVLGIGAVGRFVLDIGLAMRRSDRKHGRDILRRIWAGLGWVASMISSLFRR
jgi:hypothetical protein